MTSSNLDEAGAVRERLIEVVARIPPIGGIEARQLDKLSFRANVLKEHRPEGTRLKAEEDLRIDRGSTATYAEIERGIKLAIEVIGRDEPFKRHDSQPIKIAVFGQGQAWKHLSSMQDGLIAHPSPVLPLLFHRAGPSVLQK